MPDFPEALNTDWEIWLTRYVWPSIWGPTYRNSYAICISTSGLSILMCWIYWMHLGSLNRRLDREEEEKGQTKKGFRYIL
jgi:hypothetical protein